MGERGGADTEALLAEVNRNYIPSRVMLGVEDGDRTGDRLPLLEGRQKIDGAATAYVCENYVCQLPVTDPQALARQLVD